MKAARILSNVTCIRRAYAAYSISLQTITKSGQEPQLFGKAHYTRFPQLVKALSQLRTYIVNNRLLIPNYGERYRKGEAIATGFVESTVNEVVSKRFGKKQQMQWSKEGAHLLLQTRVRTLNGELGAIFKRRYPDMDLEVEEIPIAA